MNAFRRLNILLGGIVAVLLLSIVQRFWPECDPAVAAEQPASTTRGQSTTARGDNPSTGPLRSPPRRAANSSMPASSPTEQARASLPSRTPGSTNDRSPASPLDRAATGFQGVEMADDPDDYEETTLSNYPNLDQRNTRRSRITSG